MSNSTSTRPIVTAFITGTAVGAATLAIINHLRSGSRSKSASSIVDSPSTSNSSDASLLSSASADQSAALASANEEIAGLLQLLRQREESLSSLEAERSEHTKMMKGLFAGITDVRSMRERVKTMQIRILELEEELAQKNLNHIGDAASSSSSPSPSSSWPHIYPLINPATELPDSLKSSIEGVLFDLDGTLVESAEIWYLLLDACSKHFGYGPLARELWAPTFGQSMAANRELFFPRTSQKEIDDFCDAHYGNFVEHLHVLPGAFEALEATKNAVGVNKMTICTNCPTLITRIIIESVPKLSEYFSKERTICSGSTIHVKRPRESGSIPRYQFSETDSDTLAAGLQIDYTLHAKPSTDIILRACDIIHADPRRCVFVGDSKYDLMSSMSAECFAIGIGEKGRGGNMHIDRIGQLGEKLRR